MTKRATRTVPISCANVNHNTGPRRNNPHWGEQLGTVELAANQPDELAATAYVCEACASQWRGQLVAWQARADAHARNDNAPHPGDPPTAIDA